MRPTAHLSVYAQYYEFLPLMHQLRLQVAVLELEASESAVESALQTVADLIEIVTELNNTLEQIISEKAESESHLQSVSLGLIARNYFTGNCFFPAADVSARQTTLPALRNPRLQNALKSQGATTSINSPKTPNRIAKKRLLENNPSRFFKSLEGFLICYWIYDLGWNIFKCALRSFSSATLASLKRSIVER